MFSDGQHELANRESSCVIMRAFKGNVCILIRESEMGWAYRGGHIRVGVAVT